MKHCHYETTPFYKRWKCVLSKLSGVRTPSMISIVSEGYDRSDKQGQVIFVCVLCGYQGAVCSVCG